MKSRFGRCSFLLLVAVAAGLGMAAAAGAPQQSGMGDMGSMAHMGDHMYMTKLRPPNPADQQKAAAILAALRTAIAPYRDYHKALADGFKIFLPNVQQPQYHFTKRQYAAAAQMSFDPSKPTSLLYKKTGADQYTLVGAMYTDRVNATEDELNQRVPLSVARWHQHVNLCQAPPSERANARVGADPKFGMRGSITTKQACDAAGGTFRPHLFGWMVHIYPFETDPKKIWSVEDDDEGHDNMDRSPVSGMNMPDMKMN